MARRLFTLLSALSLLLLLALVMLWVRSYWAADGWQWDGGRGLVSANGGLHLWDYSTPDERNWAFLGFESYYDRSIYSPMRRTTTPYWFPSLLTALLPAVYLLREARRRRAPAANGCRHCGYDLRATPGRCPECGVVPVTKEP